MGIKLNEEEMNLTQEEAINKIGTIDNIIGSAGITQNVKSKLSVKKKLLYKLYNL